MVPFEILHNANAEFSQSNISLQPTVDHTSRCLIVPPDMNQVHHSMLRWEHSGNYGLNLAVWDMLFRTYQSNPEKGHENTKIGLEPYQSDATTGLG